MLIKGAGGDPGGSRSMVTPPRFAGEGRGRYAASAVRGGEEPATRARGGKGRVGWEELGLGWFGFSQGLVSSFGFSFYFSFSISISN